MAFIEVPVGDAKESEIVPEAMYDLRCEGYTLKRSKDDTRDLIVVTVSIENPPKDVNPEIIFHQMSQPNKEDSEKSRKYQILLIRRFLECFHISYESGGFDPDDIPGAKGKCLVMIDEYERNKRNVLELPPIKKEDVKKPAATKKVA